MSTSKIAQIVGKTEYPIQDVFNAVAEDIKTKREIVDSYAEAWQKDMAGAPTLRLLECAHAQLAQWIEQGATHIEPERPFTDDNRLCNPCTDNLAQQFERGAVIPLVKDTDNPAYHKAYKKLEL